MAPPTKARRKTLVGEGKADVGGGGVKRGGYPTDTPGRARAAKSYASKFEKTGRITPAKKAEIDRRADRELGKGKRK